MNNDPQQAAVHAVSKYRARIVGAWPPAAAAATLDLT
jgi:hypothetical protein